MLMLDHPLRGRLFHGLRQYQPAHPQIHERTPMNLCKAIPFAAALAVLQAQAPPMTPPMTQPMAPPEAPLPSAEAIPAQAPASVPLYRVMVVQGAAKAFNYQNLRSSTKIDMVGTVLSPKAGGVCKVKTEKGIMHITAKLRDLPPASSLGKEFLTYVLWGITPEGRATNLGEVAVKNGKCKVEVTEGTQTFGLVLTAEPYFAVTQPSDAVVMENAVNKHTDAQVELIDAKYQLLKRDQYTLNLASAEPIAMDEKTPIDIYQARNAVRIARAVGAQGLAGEAFEKAESFLKEAENQDSTVKSRIQSARESVQRAEDARLITVQRQETQRVAMEKRLIEDKLEDARKQAAFAAEAEANARKVAMSTQAENDTLHSKLKDQLNSVLQTRASAKGLIVNMSGLLFQTGKADLAPAAREKLAKIAGILAAHKGLKIEANGYTDSTGTEDFNRQLSEKRAMVTKDFLVSQGVSPDVIEFKGFGPENPIASNDTDGGRKENRRVELVVSGEGLDNKQDASPKN